MIPSAAVFALVAAGCYALALLTSYVLLKWVLAPGVTAGLGSEARYIGIDGIRGYLAFSVYIHHCLLTWVFLQQHQWPHPPHNFENQLGATSVAIFFMITAFLFWGRAQSARGLELRKFAITRLFRIYPLYLFVFVLICAAVAYETHWVARQPVASLAKEVGKWLLFRDPDINLYNRTTLIVKGVTWTLLYEAWFYVSLPLLVIVFLKRRPIWMKVIGLATIAFLMWPNHIEGWIAAAFFGGIVGVYWRRDPKKVGLAQTKWAAIVGLVCLAIVVFFLYKPFNAPGLILLSVFFVVICSGNTLFGILRIRPALWLGEISYSIYLCHGFVLWILMEHILPRVPGYQHSTGWFIASSLGITPFVILFCTASYLLVEKRFIGIGHRLAVDKRASRLMPRKERVDAVQLG